MGFDSVYLRKLTHSADDSIKLLAYVVVHAISSVFKHIRGLFWALDGYFIVEGWKTSMLLLGR